MGKFEMDVQTLHEEQIRVRLNWHQLQEIILGAVASELRSKPRLGAKNVKTNVRLESIKEGSPEYSTDRYRAVVSITIDHNYVAAEESATSADPI